MNICFFLICFIFFKNMVKILIFFEKFYFMEEVLFLFLLKMIYVLMKFGMYIIFIGLLIFIY